MRLWGHSHLDVAWLWSFDATRRKAMRTFATAVAFLERDETFVFAQSQPQLYDYVREADGELFARVRELAGRRPLRPRYCGDVGRTGLQYSVRRIAAAPTAVCEPVLPPTFRDNPGDRVVARYVWLRSHASDATGSRGNTYFATTKLYWNDTTEFPLRQFRWRGPDGSEVLAASLRGMDGGFAPWRVAAARERNEPLVVGYGDGGGGPTQASCTRRRPSGAGNGLGRMVRNFVSRIANNSPFTTTSCTSNIIAAFTQPTTTSKSPTRGSNGGSVKSKKLRPGVSRSGVPRAALERVTAATNAVWEVALRNQFHDVLPGTSIPEVYVDALADYAGAETLLDSAEAALRAMLPRARPTLEPKICVPQLDGENYVFEHASLSATVTPLGGLVDAHVSGGRNVLRHANVPAHLHRSSAQMGGLERRCRLLEFGAPARGGRSRAG